MTIRPGQHFKFDGFDLEISTGKHLPDKIIASAKIPSATIEIGNRLDVDNPEVQTVLHKIIFNLAKVLSTELLLKPASEIARNLGITPSGLRVSNARRRTLGSCNSKGLISLSPLLVFTPGEFRQYIICHELSHLSHFNHSKDFHSLCNSYCLRVTRQPEEYFKKMMKTIFQDRDSLLWSLRENLNPNR